MLWFSAESSAAIISLHFSLQLMNVSNKLVRFFSHYKYICHWFTVLSMVITDESAESAEYWFSAEKYSFYNRRVLNTQTPSESKWLAAWGYQINEWWWCWSLRWTSLWMMNDDWKMMDTDDDLDDAMITCNRLVCHLNSEMFYLNI